jgi:hypothetical protein
MVYSMIKHRLEDLLKRREKTLTGLQVEKARMWKTAHSGDSKWAYRKAFLLSCSIKSARR